jgi:hypothetical protein
LKEINEKMPCMMFFQRGQRRQIMYDISNHILHQFNKPIDDEYMNTENNCAGDTKTAE